jgi:hypothetical protein|uniref:hypothetical protein n=1 Tax=Prosthecobacter sp. TaxID=1965333 RepID=UPI003783B766
MKALLTLALVASALTLSSCGNCPLAPQKKSCPVGCAKPCCAKKAADCKTCTH